MYRKSGKIFSLFIIIVFFSIVSKGNLAKILIRVKIIYVYIQCTHICCYIVAHRYFWNVEKLPQNFLRSVQLSSPGGRFQGSDLEIYVIAAIVKSFAVQYK